MDLDVVAGGSQPLRHGLGDVFRGAPAPKQLRLDVIHADGPDVAKGFYNDGSHRSISSEE
ncbi:MAG: hypothetical protein LKF80_17050 [Brevundimonas sp.]|jgi:hypothetical protein|uniref:hypothetical protein n=1 Tax=Brevundimonas sp. TaxID=1871086 RepID=UPI0025BEE30D|nr:hypothetical protein [Brevundimonas sp.]MCH4270099.1 hypothetical protein [Brevundimonas sp.]